jgi:cysteine synthase
VDRQWTVGSSVIAAIGGTPLVALSRVTDDLDGRILAKLDYLNPGGSKKDRIALRMIEDAESSGELRPGQTVVELTSGNTGTGLAIVCAVTGHPFVAVMSAGNSVERAQMMRALGAEVVLVDQQEESRVGHVSGQDLALVEEAAGRIAAERGAFRADQFHLVGNPAAHEDGTAREIWRQSGGDVGAFCEFVGTGGTFTGVARHLKERDPSIGCYVIEPDGAAALKGDPVVRPGHRIQGGGYSMPFLPLLDPHLVDGFLTVGEAEAIDAARRLARSEGILAGFSGGACLAGRSSFCADLMRAGRGLRRIIQGRRAGVNAPALRSGSMVATPPEAGLPPAHIGITPER